MFENDEHLEEFPEEVAKKEKLKEEEQTYLNLFK